MTIQEKYDTLYRFFKTTTEYFDSIEITTEGVDILYNDIVIEHYTEDDVADLISDYTNSKH